MAEQVELLFESEIRPNIDTRAAEAQIKRLQRSAERLEDQFNKTFSGVERQFSDFDYGISNVKRTVESGTDAVERVFKDHSSSIGSIMDSIKGRIEGTWKSTWDKVVHRSIVPDGIDATEKEFERMGGITENVVAASNKMAEGFDQALGRMQQSVETFTPAVAAVEDLSRQITRMSSKQIEDALSFLPEQIRSRIASMSPDLEAEYISLLDKQKAAIDAGLHEEANIIGIRLKEIEQKFVDFGFGLRDSALQVEYSMREMRPTIVEAMGGVARSFQLARAEGVGLAGAMPIMVDAVGDLGQRLGFFSDKTVSSVRNLSGYAERLSGMFRRLSGDAKQIDGSMLATSKRIDTVASSLKNQQQVFSRLFEENIRSIKKRMAARAREAEQNKDLTAEDIADIQRKNAADADRIRSMKVVYTRNISAIGSQLNKLEDNTRHFLTTLQNTGRVSGERIRDIEHAIGGLGRELSNASKTGLANIPGLSNWFGQMTENINIASRSVRELGAHEERLEATNEKLNNSFLETGKRIGGIRGAIGRFIPMIGRAQKESGAMADNVQRTFSRMGNGVQQTTDVVSYALADLDPMFMSVAHGGREMGMAMDEVMTNMASVAESESGSIVKALSTVKFISAGIIAAFSGLIISTGKLASEVTTLGITMRAVAKNTGYSTDAMDRWVEVLKDTGITTRAATNALTQFMRAKLPTNWNDPIMEASFSIKDMARSAQNLAVSMNTDSSAAFSRFIQFVQTGNSQLLDAIGISKNASVMLKEYADALGLTVKQLSERQRYEALISGLMRESAKVQGVYEEAMKTASKQLGSMKRYLEELRLEWGKYFEPILATIIFNFNKLLKILTKIPAETKQAVTTFITIATAISGIGLSLTVALPKIKGVLTILKPVIGILTGKFQLLVGVIGIAAAALGKLFFKIEAEGEGVEGIANRVQYLIDNIGEVTGALQPIADWISSFLKMIKTHFGVISYRISRIIDDLKSKVGSFVDEHPELMEFLEKAKIVLSDLFTVVYTVVDKVLGAIGDLLSQDWEGFFGKLEDAGKYIITWAVEFFQEVVVSAYEWGKALISSFVTGLIARAREAIPGAMTQIGNLISMFLEGHSPAKKGPLSNIGSWGTGIMSEFERSLRRRKIAFDEGMFTGLSGLSGSAKAWGDNIIGVFMDAIVGKAARAVGPAMDTVGRLLGSFLEGHSPPKEGKLSEIEDWGKNVFEAFLTAFEVADFSILDRALSLVRERITSLVGDAESAGAQVAQAMIQVREAVAGAIAEARATGGPLDLSALRELIVGTMTVYAQDVAAVVEAMFDAMQAQEVFNNLQEKINAAREARATAIKAAEERLRSITDGMKAIQDEVKALEERIEAEVEARLEVMNLMVDEKLMDELGRQLEEANRDIRRAQARLQRVRAGASKYGLNILTWEEINAAAQMELAQRRRDEIQSQIDVQEQIQTEIERVRAEVAEQYESQFTALEEQLEAAKERAEFAQEQIEGLRRANQTASEEENKQLAEAQEHAREVAAHAQLLSILLDQRMKAEEDYAKALEGVEEKIDEAAEAIEDVGENLLKNIQELEENIDGWDEYDEPPQFSIIFNKWLDKMGLSLEDGIPGLITGIQKKLQEAIVEIKNQVVEKINEIIVNTITGVLEFTGLDKLVLLMDQLNILKLPIQAFDNLQRLLKLAFVYGGLFLGKVKEFISGRIKTLLEENSEIVDRVKEGFRIAKENLISMIGGLLILATKIPFVSQFVDLLSQLSSHATSIVESGMALIMKGLLVTLLKFAPVADGIIMFFSELTQIFIDLASGNMAALAVDAAELVEAIGKILGMDPSAIASLIDPIVSAIDGMVEGIVNAVGSIVGIIVAPFQEAYNILVGNSIIPEMVSEVLTLIASIPTAIFNMVADFAASATAIGIEVYTGFKSQVLGILNEIDMWFYDISEKVSGTAEMFLQSATTAAIEIFNSFQNEIAHIFAEVDMWFFDISEKVKGTAEMFFNSAVSVASGIVDGFRERILGPDGIMGKIGGWLSSVVSAVNAQDVLSRFADAGRSIGETIISSISEGINRATVSLSGAVKGIWNNHLRGPLQDVINSVANSVNSLIRTLNDAASVIGFGDQWPFPIGEINAPQLPSLDVGGITLQDTVAQLHAGEVVMPLDRLDQVLNKAFQAGKQQQQVPAFAPHIILNGSARPEDIQPAIEGVYDWWVEKSRSG